MVEDIEVIGFIKDALGEIELQEYVDISVPLQGYTISKNAIVTELGLYGFEIYDLEKIADYLGLLKNLVKLDLGGTYIENIFPIANLKHIRYLDLRDNNISDISVLSQFKNLVQLNIGNNKITECSSISELVKLSDLSIHKNNIVNISFLSKLISLQELNISDNQIDNLSSIAALSRLTTLNARNNNIIMLEQLSSLNQLTHLDLGRNNIRIISPIEKLSKLRYLDLSENYVNDISPLSQLNNLMHLDLSNNKLNNTSCLGTLTGLTYLNLGNNKVDDIEFIENFKKIKQLDLQSITAEKLPEWVCETRLEITYKRNPLAESSSEYINLYNTYFESPPNEVIRKGKEAIKSYFKELRDESDYMYEAKLILVGEERAGKSTLAEALSIDDFKINLKKESTMGINIKRWSVPPSKTQLPENFYFNIWDFGGQEIYHSTHQFFLTKRSLYLFVTEARKDLRFDDFYYWLNIINTLAGNSSVILVQNKTDQDHKSQSIDEYRKIFPQIFSDLQTVSCNTNHIDWETIYLPKLQMLKENIFKVLKENKIKGVGDRMPNAWLDIRKEIHRLLDKGFNYISLDEYLKICEYKGLNEDKAYELSDYFHDLGVFLHFKDDIQLRDILFINPEWLTKAIYRILDSKKVKESYGKFTNRDLLELWNEPQFVGREKELISLMKNPQFRVCYEHENDYYLAPQLFSDKMIDWNFDTDEDIIRFRYQYEFMPKGILSQLIVAMHKFIYKEIYWLYGVVFEYKGSKAILKENRFNKRNLITIDLQGLHRKEFLSIIRCEIDEINKKYTNLRITEEYGCKCSECVVSADPFFYSSEFVEKAIKKRIRTVQCHKSLEDVSISELIEAYDDTEKEGYNQMIKILEKDIDNG